MPAGPRSVLVVEDDPLVLEVLTRICSELFAEVVVRTNGTDALALIATRTFDLLITDLRMPGENGLVLLAETRRRAPTQPTLLISGYADEEASSEALRLGAEVLHKPFGARALRQTIATLCPEVTVV